MIDKHPNIYDVWDKIDPGEHGNVINDDPNATGADDKRVWTITAKERSEMFEALNAVLHELWPAAPVATGAWVVDLVVASDKELPADLFYGQIDYHKGFRFSTQVEAEMFAATAAARHPEVTTALINGTPIRSKRPVDAVYAEPYDTVEGEYVGYQGHGDHFPFIADAWYFQSGGTWVAVVRDWEPEDEWFEDDAATWPTPRTYPIDQTPPFGTLLFRAEDGTPITRPLKKEPSTFSLNVSSGAWEYFASIIAEWVSNHLVVQLVDGRVVKLLSVSGDLLEDDDATVNAAIFDDTRHNDCGEPVTLTGEQLSDLTLL
jgi:hypothetical protein